MYGKSAYIKIVDIRNIYIKNIYTSKNTAARDAFFIGSICVKNAFVEDICINNISIVNYLEMYLQSF